MRRAFTIVELMAVIAIIGMMVAVGVSSIVAGKGAARVKGATRDIFGSIRHARSTALVTGQPAIITYSTVQEDGEVMAKVELTSAKLFDSSGDRSKVQTLSGEPLKVDGEELVHVERGGKTQKSKKNKGQELVHIEESKAEAFGKDKKTKAEPADDGEGEGQTVEEILFAPVNSEVVKGMRLKVVLGDEDLREESPVRKTKVSMFSNVDYLIGRFKDAKAEQKKKEAAEKGEDAADQGADVGEDQEPVSVVWETNGRVEPHQVWVYADGQKPEDGLLIRIDRFGAAKVLRGDGRDDED